MHLFGFNLNKKLTERLYKQNLDFAVKNTTFYLLEKLYQASILTLTPEAMAVEITDIVRKDLDIELMGIYIFEKDTDALSPLAFAKSDHLIGGLNKLEFLFGNTKITDISRHGFFRKIVYGREDAITKNLRDVYENMIAPPDLEKLETESDIKNLLAYPLVKGQEVLGVLCLGINRDYDNIGIFERSSIKSIINAIALLIDKAFLYKNLLVSYEIEKRGRAEIQQAYEIEKKYRQDLLKLDQDKNDFMLITQHHLRTPLTSMAWHISSVERGLYGKVPKKLQSIMHTFNASTRVLIKIVDEFLDISQFQLGKKVIKVSNGVNLDSVVRTVVKELAQQAKAKKIFLRVSVPRQALPLIEADALKLSTAIMSVIDDAVKYTAKGGVTVQMEAVDSKVQIIVQDTGMGIEKSQLPQLFDSIFSRSQKAQEVNVTGRGLGLYLASKIIQAHGGKIWAKSEGKDRGSTFYIQLPIAQDKVDVAV